MATATRKRQVRTSVAKPQASESDVDRFDVEIHDVPKNAKAGWRPKSDALPLDTEYRDCSRSVAQSLAEEYNAKATNRKSTLRAFAVQDWRSTGAHQLAENIDKLMQEITKEGENFSFHPYVFYRNSWNRARGFRFSLSMNSRIDFPTIKGLIADDIADILLREIIANAEMFILRIRNTAEKRAAAAKGGAV